MLITLLTTISKWTKLAFYSETTEISSSTLVCLQTNRFTWLARAHDPWPNKGTYVVYPRINDVLLISLKYAIIYHFTLLQHGFKWALSIWLLFQAKVCPSISANLVTARGICIHLKSAATREIFLWHQRKIMGSCSWVHNKLLGLPFGFSDALKSLISSKWTVFTKVILSHYLIRLFYSILCRIMQIYTLSMLQTIGSFLCCVMTWTRNSMQHCPYLLS